MTDDFIPDYIIVGAGSAGCVLAARLTEDPGTRVLLLEAGGEDSSPLVHMPKGIGKLLSDPKHVWFFQTEAHDGSPSETWVRGKTLGGSSSVNGMMYFRGQPEDYDEWVRLGATGWDGDAMWAAFRAMEGHALGGDGERGGDGPLKVSIDNRRTELSEALIGAAVALGVPRREDLNRRDHEGVGYGPRTIARGRRQSAARAFLTPARKRPNLRVVTDVTVDRVLFDGLRAFGVAARRGGAAVEFHTPGEVILSAGSLQSPKLLQLSGIGPAEILLAAGISVRVANPHVGRHMREHRLLMMQNRLLRPLSENRQFSGARLVANVLRYQLTRSGPLASAAYQVAAFVRTRPGLDRPDAEILAAPYSLDVNAGGVSMERRHGIHAFGYPLRSVSEGTVEIRSNDPDAPASILPNYLADAYDQEVTVATFRMLRRWMSHPSLAGLVGEETMPGPAVESDEAIVGAFRAYGNAGYHACGTCRMGRDGDGVLDAALCVRGVRGLRVVDGSVMPTMTSGNTNGPIMAIGWRAADVIRGRAGDVSAPRAEAAVSRSVREEAG